MKKKIIPLTAACMALAITLSGCSCTGATPLNFSDDFNAGNKPSVNYTETLTYKVQNIDSYEDKFSKSTIITDDVLKYDMLGTYTMTLKVLDKTDENVSKLQSDILTDESNTESLVYYLKTELNLTTNYKAAYEIYLEDENTAVKEKSFNENITTETYFLPSGYSFNPIYSETQGKTSFVQISDNAMAAVIFAEYSTKTLYNKDKYIITEKFNSSEPTTKEHGYSFKTVIDNNELLFAIRNVSLEVEKDYSIPVVHPTFGDAQKLTIKNEKEYSKKIKLNGETQDTSIPIKEYSFMRNVQNATGTPQYVLIQKEKVGEIPNKALIIEYTSPLVCYGSYVCMGGLQYTLESYSFS